MFRYKLRGENLMLFNSFFSTIPSPTGYDPNSLPGGGEISKPHRKKIFS